MVSGTLARAKTSGMAAVRGKTPRGFRHVYGVLMPDELANLVHHVLAVISRRLGYEKAVEAAHLVKGNGLWALRRFRDVYPCETLSKIRRSKARLAKALSKKKTGKRAMVLAPWETAAARYLSLLDAPSDWDIEPEVDAPFKKAAALVAGGTAVSVAARLAGIPNATLRYRLRPLRFTPTGRSGKIDRRAFDDLPRPQPWKRQL